MIGTDIVKISRINLAISKYGNDFLSKFLNSDEIKLVKNTKTAAGFWAAKEAASKALGVGIGAQCSFHDIFLSKLKSGAPTINFSKSVIDNFKIKSASVSISHDGDYAISVVALEIF